MHSRREKPVEAKHPDRGQILAESEDVPRNVEDALWLQTRNGEDWVMEAWMAEEDGESVWEIPTVRDQIADWLLDRLLEAAGGWSNDRIRRFIETSWQMPTD